MITVIERSTSEYNQEIKNNFNKIQPFLDDGYSYTQACIIVGLASSRSCSSLRWFKDLKKYGETQGYPYKDYNRSKKVKR